LSGRRRAIARNALTRICIGTAAWSNPPAERRNRAEGESHLEHYATHFNAVEINSSFYRSHQSSTYGRWRESTPATFRFSVKVPRSVSHEHALRHCREQVREFLGEVVGLGEKLRVLLVQTPGSLEFELAVVRRFFAALAAAAPCHIVCEPRHASWFTSRAEETLGRYGVGRVAADPARAPEAGEPGGARSLVYYRLHGSPRMYYSAYNREYLKELSRKMRSPGAGCREVWCVFDNTARHASWGNALELQRLVGLGGRAIDL
jgi:uncharacterized protein YecE (DUF72 family)